MGFTGNRIIFRKTQSFSNRSLNAISLHCTGQELGVEEIKWLSLKITKEIKELLNEAGKYARRTRNDRVRLSHIQHATLILCPDVFSRLVLPMKMLAPIKVVTKSKFSQSAPKAGPMQLNVNYMDEPENSSALQIRRNSPLDSVWLKQKRAGWMRQEQARFMPCKNFPLTKEQLDFYQMLTETCVCASGSQRNLALYALSTDPTLDVLLPRLGVFIADAVAINVAQQNIGFLFYLMRMVKALLSNKSLNLNKYLHLILPAVLTCLLTKQVVDQFGLVDHWSLREYSGSIATEIVRNHEVSDSNLLPRVVGIYKKALLKGPLTTVYGAVIGLGKMGDDAVRACILPNLKYLSGRIEVHLVESKEFCSASMNTLASKLVNHRLMKMCTPLLACKPYDSPEVYVEAYGTLGSMLRLAAIVARIKAEAEIKAKEKAKADRLRQAKKEN